MKLIEIGIVALVASLLGGVAAGLIGGNQSAPAPLLGGVTNFDALTLDNGDLTLRNGDIVVSTPTSGTSTIGTVGCVQMNATSTATTIKLTFNITSTTTLQGTSNGMVAWAYGTCP